ncbi:ATP-binding cassette domain-containing protein [Roseomonas sp. GC11]|uniref:ATP-binding cassette domain-containing protein n=1 Tax=Roseomonas sp. GC11 TaxID=2950546 RepID=UPI00210B056B|nr:ATP-binding cassette domain-containing protein [Roseomonas sp. GC11]MCQ4158690.1 ATP-binding cassette domain-containing protein [Roseomonas sp. GC11]
MPEDDPLFQLEEAGFRAGPRWLLHPLSLRLAPGRIIGLIGHNGSGKSTLLKLLARQMAPSQGQIRFAGRPLAAWGGRDLARQVAYLPQHPAPAPGMLVRELVALGRYPWHGALGRFGAADAEKVEAALRATEVAALAERQVETLSGGERQRAWLAMLVAQEARCLLLDEPISALDVAHQVEVLELVRRLGRERRIGTILVLHDVNMAARYCDEIIALHSGRLVAQGEAAAMMRAETLRDIYGLPFVMLPHPAGAVPLAFPA